MIIVPAAGKRPNDVLLVGEAPGENEARLRRPFVGKSGEAQEWYLSRHELSAKSWRVTNVVCEYREGNPDPTPEQIAYWTGKLIEEIKITSPKLIVAVGRFAARWFLGEKADLQDCHGLPHVGGQYDSTIQHRANGAVVVPIYHPAWGLRAENAEAKAILAWDYSQVAHYLSIIRSGQRDSIDFRQDKYKGRERYLDVSGEELADLISADRPELIGLDTEGFLPSPWSVQISTRPGFACTLRTSQPDFYVGIRRLQELVDSGCLIVTHQAGTPMGCMHDTQICRAMGLELTDAEIWDTMYAAYLLRLESKSLKSLSFRWCGMEMEDYESLIGDVAKSKQIDYLCRVLDRAWPKPETRIVRENDGTFKPYTPQAIDKFALGILRDIDSGKLNKDGLPTNPYNRWQGKGSNKGIDIILRKMVESELGPMPTATLDDIALDRAIFYSGRDPDATLRLFDPLHGQLSKEKLLGLMSTGMQVLPMFEEMQHVGMPASRAKFSELSSFVHQRMIELQRKISIDYCDGQPINPGSFDQVGDLMEKRGIKGEKRTKTGKISTAKKSIEHLRHSNPAISDIVDWREHAKIKSTYCDPIIKIAEEQEIDPQYPDAFTVHTKFKPVTVTSRRLSAEKPSMLNQPVRTDLGRRVRDCYQAYGDEVFAAHDFSGQEARVAAHVCNIAAMIALFSKCRYCGCALDQQTILKDKCHKSPNDKHKGCDIHDNTATRVFGVTGDDIDYWGHRQPCKTGIFGIFNGMKGPGLLDQFRMYIPPQFDPDGRWSKLDNCMKLVDEIERRVYPELHSTFESVFREIKRTGVVRDLFGMIRYLPKVWSRDPKEVAEAGREGFNHIIQGTAQGITQNAMAWLRPRFRQLQKQGYNIRPCLQIHDELIVRMSPDMWDIVDPLVTEAFTQHYGLQLRVPVESEGHMAKSWGQLK